MSTIIIIEGSVYANIIPTYSPVARLSEVAYSSSTFVHCIRQYGGRLFPKMTDTRTYITVRVPSPQIAANQPNRQFYVSSS